jgi:hypothetical protein
MWKDLKHEDRGRMENTIEFILEKLRHSKSYRWKAKTALIKLKLSSRVPSWTSQPSASGTTVKVLRGANRNTSGDWVMKFLALVLIQLVQMFGF